MGKWQIHNQDVVKWSKEYEDEKFHALFCDSPYHLTSIVKRFGKAKESDKTKTSEKVRNRSDGYSRLISTGFMGQTWDGGDLAFQKETWQAFGNVLYDGAFGMAFSASRNWHRMAVAIEDAGFIIHPTMFFLWVQGQGFPKATKIKDSRFAGHKYGLQAIKPAVEPIIVFQKPYGKRPIDDILQTGAGALNIDSARIPLNDGDEYSINEFTDGMKPFGNGAGHKYKSKKVKNDSCLGGNGSWKTDKTGQNVYQGGYSGEKISSSPAGRYPANLILDNQINFGEQSRFYNQVSTQIDEADPYYYCAKVNPKERSAGLNELPDRAYGQSGGAQGAIERGESEYKQNSIGLNRVQSVKNNHPTLKPIELCVHIAKLLLPPVEYAPRRIFVPFSGVASEMIGCVLAGWDEVVGVEFDTQNGYVNIGEKRLQYWSGKDNWHKPKLF